MLVMFKKKHTFYFQEAFPFDGGDHEAQGQQTSKQNQGNFGNGI